MPGKQRHCDINRRIRSDDNTEQHCNGKTFQSFTADVQMANVKIAAEAVAAVAKEHKVVLTHGNGNFDVLLENVLPENFVLAENTETTKKMEMIFCLTSDKWRW